MSVRAIIVLLLLTTCMLQAEDTKLPLSSLDLKLLEQGWGSPKINTSVDNNPLRIGGVSYTQGIGSHADSRLLIEVGGATRFSAIVGIDDEVGKRGSARFRVIGDRKTLFDSGMMLGGDAGKPIDVPLAGVKQLLLITTAGNQGIDFCHVNWASAEFTYSGHPPRAIALPREEAVILTPPAPREPRINGAKIFGVRPSSPILYTVAATGDRPMTFSAEGLPEGVALDSTTGQISGSLTTRGTYSIKLIATNNLSSTSRDFKLVVGDKIALTPPMGWNSWNCFAEAVDEAKVKSAVDNMVKSGLINHGWSYINIDDFWQKSPKSKDPTLGGIGRDSEGNIVPNPRFPDMKALVDYIHSKGFKAGIYSSPGPLTCGGCIGSFDHEEQDVKKYVEWGFDYLKYDWCSYAPRDEARRGTKIDLLQEKQFGNSLVDQADPQKVPYKRMGEILRKQNRDIVYSLCQYGLGNVWEWGDQVGGNCWRTTHDITDTWASMSRIGFSQNQKQGVTGPGQWSDPDMLIVGRVGWGRPHPTRLTPNEQYTHITLWSILSAPLLIGCDMSQLDEFTLNLLTNDEVIAINQDPLGKQAWLVKRNENTEVWSKQLEDGSIAVALFNLGEMEETVQISWKELGIEGNQTIRDLWRQKDIGDSTSNFASNVARHGVVFVRLIEAK